MEGLLLAKVTETASPSPWIGKWGGTDQRVHGSWGVPFLGQLSTNTLPQGAQAKMGQNIPSECHLYVYPESTDFKRL